MRSKREEILFWLDQNGEIEKNKRNSKYILCYKDTNQRIRISDAAIVLGVSYELMLSCCWDWLNQKMGIE